MLRGYLDRHLGRNKEAIIHIWFICVLLLSSCFYGKAQQINPSKPQNGTNAFIKHKKDSSAPKVANHKTATPKKDSTHHHQLKADSQHTTPKSITHLYRKDSTIRKKTITAIVHNHNDSLARANKLVKSITPISSSYNKKDFVPKTDLRWNKALSVPYLPLKTRPIYVMDDLHPHTSKDLLFFAVCGLFLLYGITRTTFPKYTDNIFRNLFSFTTFDKSENSLGQNNLPSLLLNALFCLSFGLLAALMIEQTQNISYPIWQVWLSGSVLLATIYFVKFITIYASGWIFNASADASAYMYVVFLINKMIGLLSLPAILVLAFAENPLLNQYLISIGSILLIVLLLYRYIVTFSVIARNLQLNAFHFFLYLCSVEVIPILILYKLFFKDLINWVR